MERLTFTYEAGERVNSRAHVGVVGSGDLEILMELSPDQQTHVVVSTSVNGYGPVWKIVLDRFFSRFDAAVSIEINDFGATPGMVALRLEQAVEVIRS
ncbi:malonate decarboxylase subunit delta [Govanella unica]|uniref:Malonate decarboxylase acyl carrier protein n=1 Tax=Govanella unica TaxID=2975056 RepID=A0A9X3TYR8_9PROT|nr:malonate decarboxylase subunit delta [Govania unica]MDA5194200.1 malonate decarboxylase subunit delta [Govania unica]